MVAPPPAQRTRRCGDVVRRVIHASEWFCSAADQAVGLSGAGPRRSRRFDGVATPGQEPRRSRGTSRQRVGCPGVAAKPCDVAPSWRGRFRLPPAVSSVELRSPCVRHLRRLFGEPAAIFARTLHHFLIRASGAVDLSRGRFDCRSLSSQFVSKQRANARHRFANRYFENNLLA